MHRLLLVGLVAIPLFAAAPPARPDAARLIAQLGDRDFARRDLAQRRLMSLGPSVLPALSLALRDPDPEVRRRLLRLIGPLERERDFAPTRFTATFRDAPLDTVLTRIQADAGLRVLYLDEAGVGMPRFTGSFRDATFWEALDRLCAGCKLMPMEASDEKRGVPAVGLRSAKRAGRFVTRQGAFRLSVHNVQQQRALDLDDDVGNDEPPAVGLTLTAMAEPRFEFVDVGQPRLESATDDRGRSLLPSVRGNPLDEEGGALPTDEMADSRSGSATVNVGVMLSRHHADSKRIRSVKGILPVRVIIGRTTRVLVEKLVKGQTFERGEHRFEVEQVKALKKRLEVRVKVKPAAGMPGQIAIDTDLANELEFRDDDGNVCRHTLQEQPVPDAFVLRVSPSRKGGKPAVRLFIKEPIVRAVEIPFEFRDLPLP